VELWEWLILSLIVTVFLVAVVLLGWVALKWHRTLCKVERRYGIRKERE
jgi:hypothetical protein